MEIEESEGQGVSRRTLCHEGKHDIQRTSNEHGTTSIGTKHSIGITDHQGLSYKQHMCLQTKYITTVTAISRCSVARGS